MLHERVIRPAEVGVTEAVDNKEAEQGSEAWRDAWVQSLRKNMIFFAFVCLWQKK